MIKLSTKGATSGMDTDCIQLARVSIRELTGLEIGSGTTRAAVALKFHAAIKPIVYLLSGNYSHRLGGAI